MKREYSFCVGDVVVFNNLTYDVIKATYGYIIIKNDIGEVKITKKNDFKKLILLQKEI